MPTKVIDSQMSELRLPTHYSAFTDYPSFRFLQQLRPMLDNLGLKDCYQLCLHFSLCIGVLPPALSKVFRGQRKVRTPTFLLDTDVET